MESFLSNLTALLKPGRSFNILLLIILCVSMVSCTVSKNSHQIIEQKLPPGKLKADFILLQKILEANHPSLYWYTPKDSIDFYFKTTIDSITDSLTEPQFKNKVSWVISKIRCGHTSVRSSKKYTKASRSIRQPQFPLSMKIWDDSLVVLGSALPKDSVFKRGTVVTAINGKTPAELLDSMYQLISTDGYSNNFKSQLISFSFPGYYKNAFGLGKEYQIAYIDSAGHSKNAVIPNYNFPADTTAKFMGNRNSKPSKKQRRKLQLLYKRSLEIDTTTSTAYMRVTAFSGGGFRNFYRSAFKKLAQENIQNLIIDLRENGGGKMNASNLLARYLVNHPFKNADTVAAISRSFKYGRYIHPSFIYWISMHAITKKEKDGRYHFRYFENHTFKPKEKYHYNGQVYFLQGGYTFSASCMVLSVLKDQPNITLVGEETGGGAYGNSSVHLPNIVLPHSKIRIVLPMFRVVYDAQKQKNGRGVMPDIFISPSSAAIKQGIDIKLSEVKKIIEQKEGIKN